MAERQEWFPVEEKRGKINQIMEELRAVSEVLNTAGQLQPVHLALLCERLRQIAVQEIDFLRKLSYGSRIEAELNRFQAEEFGRLKEIYQLSTDEEKRRLEIELRDWKKVLIVRKEKEAIMEQIKKQHRDFAFALGIVMRSIQKKEPKEARQWVQKARNCVEGILRSSIILERYDKKLLSITENRRA